MSEFFWKCTGRYFFHYYCFGNSYLWLKFLKKIGIEIGLCFSVRANYRSTVEQKRFVFSLCLWCRFTAMANGTFHSKLDQNDPYGSNLRKSRQKCIDTIFLFSSWIGFLRLEWKFYKYNFEVDLHLSLEKNIDK